MGVPAVMVDVKGNPIPGIVPDKDIFAHPDRHSRAVMKDFYKSPEFCGACHKASIPRELSGYKWLRAIGLYDEWQSSALSQQSPLPFYQKAQMTCQDCHMPRDSAGQNEYGAKRGTFASHRWVGGNTAVPFYYGLEDQLQKTVDFLENKTLNVDIFAIKKPGLEGLLAPLGSTEFVVNPDEPMDVFVVIQNRGIGHSLIPEQRDFYEAWVEFFVKDRDGKELFHSGFLNPDGTLDQAAHSFTNRLVDADSQLLSKHEIWLRRAVAYDQTILPGRSTVVCYEFRIPGDVKGPLSITSRVNYRHFNQGYLDYILGSNHAPYPIVEMASQTRTISLGNNPPTGDPGENPDWMRWNNFGIGLIDQGRFGAAVNAFEHVTTLRPDYADGYTNVALANLLWEKYAAAHAGVQNALVLSAGNPRALYYRGLIERIEGDLNAAVADLEQVSKQFPRSRDVLRELAVSYYLMHRDELARQEFETVQGIDPDDLSAHYYLAILYRRCGMTAKAAEQAAFYADKRDDLAAPTRSELFLRMHPEAGNESLPLHVHSEAESGKASGLMKH
jgi:tetratricopeptide (TPR) repeat protein